MKCYEIVGYVNGDCIICPNCATEEDMDEKNGLPVIFADSEWDFYPICDSCGTEITDVCLTETGIDYIETISKIAVDISDLRRNFFNPFLGKMCSIKIWDYEYSGFDPVGLLNQQDPNLYDKLFSEWLEQEIDEDVLYKDRHGDYFADMKSLKERNR